MDAWGPQENVYWVLAEKEDVEDGDVLCYLRSCWWPNASPRVDETHPNNQPAEQTWSVTTPSSKAYKGPLWSLQEKTKAAFPVLAKPLSPITAISWQLAVNHPHWPGWPHNHCKLSTSCSKFLVDKRDIPISPQPYPGLTNGQHWYVCMYVYNVM